MRAGGGERRPYLDRDPRDARGRVGDRLHVDGRLVVPVEELRGVAIGNLGDRRLLDQHLHAVDRTEAGVDDAEGEGAEASGPATECRGVAATCGVHGSSHWQLVGSADGLAHAPEDDVALGFGDSKLREEVVELRATQPSQRDVQLDLGGQGGAIPHSSMPTCLVGDERADELEHVVEGLLGETMRQSELVRVEAVVDVGPRHVHCKVAHLLTPLLS